MRNIGITKRLFLGISIGFLSFASNASQESNSWPNKPIRIIVPFAAGGSNDIMARKISDSLSRNLGQPVIVENKPGAGSVVGTSFVAKSKPDGYNLLLVSSTVSTTPAIHKLNYDPVKDLQPIIRLANAPFVLITRKDFPAKNIIDFLEYARNNPGKINYGTAGVGDSAHLISEYLSQKTGIKMEAVPYQGISPAQIDLIAGRLDMLITTLASIKGTPGESLPRLAITTNSRDKFFGAVPTISESINKEFNVDIWWGIFAPAGTPSIIVNKLNNEISNIIRGDDFSGFINNMGANVNPSSPDELNSIIEKEVVFWKDVAKTSNINK